MNSSSPPLLRLHGLAKAFPGVQALRGVDLEVAPGEVHALLGENGAGKSTLIKILAGAQSPDGGAIEFDGRSVRIDHPAAARKLGIAVIHQELNLVPTLSARDNLFLGQEQTRGGWISARREREQARALLRRIGLQVDLECPCRDLAIAQQQVVEIAKALAVQARLIIMDEPSAALSPREVAGLLKCVRELKWQGIAVVYVSHRLDEVFEIADRATILRDGARVATAPIAELTRARVIELMVGRRLDQEYPPRRSQPGPERLKVSGLIREPHVRNVSFSIRRGEILGLTGLVGAGRTETARLIFGADRADSGTIELDGRTLRIRSPRDAIAASICLLTEDRKSQGLVLGRSILENFSLPNLGRFASRGWIWQRIEQAAFRRFTEQLRIKAASHQQLARQLSGGNQQKIVLAKWLQRQAEVILFDEPTRGIDVGARYEIYQLMQDLAAEGKAILMISSELPEVLGMADRILVMHAGRITGEIAHPAEATQAQIMDLAVR